MIFCFTSKKIHCVKVSKYGVFSGLYFSAFGTRNHSVTIHAVLQFQNISRYLFLQKSFILNIWKGSEYASEFWFTTLTTVNQTLLENLLENS